MSDIKNLFIMLIYKVTNILNHQVYVGQTIYTLEKRKSEHEKEALNKNRKTVKFHNALLKYGFENFKWEALKECDSQEELDYYETLYIEKFNCLDRNKGYNLKSGGKLGGCYSKEAKENMGESTKKKWENPECALKMLEGLRKGTETVKLKALNNYKSHECPVCHKEFKTKNWNTHTYCSLKCANLALKSSMKEKSILGTKIIKENYKKVKDNRYNLILEWAKNKENIDLVNNSKLNNLKYLNALADYVGVKDTRSLGKVLNVEYKKDIHNKLKDLIKMYAVPSDDKSECSKEETPGNRG